MRPCCRSCRFPTCAWPRSFRGQQPASSAEIGPHLRRALRLIGCRCLHHWRLHRIEPAGTWQRIHRIVAAAQQYKVLAEPAAEDAETVPFVPDSVERLTARIGVLAASQAWSLQGEEIAALAHWVQAVPVQCVAYSAAAGTLPDTTSRLWLSLHGDESPSLIVGAPPEEDAGAWHIELQPVLAALRATPPDAPAPAEPGVEPLDKRLRKR
jgi:cyclic-di-GMP-binding protein